MTRYLFACAALAGALMFSACGLTEAYGNWIAGTESSDCQDKQPWPDPGTCLREVPQGDEGGTCFVGSPQCSSSADVCAGGICLPCGQEEGEACCGAQDGGGTCLDGGACGLNPNGDGYFVCGAPGSGAQPGGAVCPNGEPSLDGACLSGYVGGGTSTFYVDTLEPTCVDVQHTITSDDLDDAQSLAQEYYATYAMAGTLGEVATTPDAAKFPTITLCGSGTKCTLTDGTTFPDLNPTMLANCQLALDPGCTTWGPTNADSVTCP